MAHSVMKFAHRSSHDGVRYLPHHAVKMWQKIHVGDTARKSLARDSASHAAFFCHGTFSVELWLFRAPLISRRGATLASPWQQILAKNHVEGAAPESLAQRSASRPSFVLSWDNGTCIDELWLFHVSLTSPRQQKLSKKNLHSYRES